MPQTSISISEPIDVQNYELCTNMFTMYQITGITNDEK